MSANKINIIGSGNVAFWLSKGISSLDFDVSIVTRKDPSEVEAVFNLPAITTVENDAEVAIICVPDDAIATVANGIPEGPTIVHTSGATSITALNKHTDIGVFYPMQTLTKDKEVNLADLPIGLEFSNDIVEHQLVQLSAFTQKVQHVNSDQRLKFHLAAVFVNNFGNQMLEIAYHLAEESGLGSAVLHPLMKETVNKALTIGPSKAQTGPAARNDIQTIEKHLKLLSEHPHYRDIYELLTKEIKRKHDHH